MKPPRIIARGKYFWLAYYEKGKKNEQRKPTGLVVDIPVSKGNWWKKSRHKPQLAALIKDIEFGREAGKRGYEIPPESKNTPESLKELLLEFNAARDREVDRVLSKATYIHRRNAVDYFVRQLSIPWHTVTRERVLDIRNASKKQFAPATLRGWFTVLKMIYEYAVREEYIRVNPFRGVIVSVPHSAPKRMDAAEEEELFRFLYHARLPLFEHVLFERLTGIRAQHICNLEWSAIRGNVLLYYNPKGHRYEELPLSRAAQFLLSHIEQRGKYIFAYRTRRTIGYYLQRATVFGAPKAVTHQMKRSYLQEIDTIAKPGVRILQALAQHSATANKVAVEHYTGQDKAEMLRALELAQSHWLPFLKKLYREAPAPGTYVFANKKSKHAHNTVHT